MGSRLPTTLMQQALRAALIDANMSVSDLDALIAVPSLAEPRFMEAHNLSTQIGLLPRPDVIVRTIDTGGAGPISALLEAKRLIETEGRHAVAVVAGDAVSSLSREEFLKRADQSCQDPNGSLPSPVIPHGYDRIAQWQTRTHPVALTRRPHTLDDVLSSPQIAPSTTLLECARRADGAAALIVASSRFMEKGGFPVKRSVEVISGGEASGSLYPPPIDEINENVFSCQQAARIAYAKAHLGVSDIDFFGLYDCFPICLIRAIESVGLAPVGTGGDYVEQAYNEVMSMIANNGLSGARLQEVFPINTHGGLLSFGAPWEAPALYLVIEAIMQLTGQAKSRQIPNAKRALVYGNGGIFSSSAVAILGSGQY
ncbi:unnamed protein product (mitochondrion) [Plasmodiophora brassicae]|uniref:Thiolase C-terminal domain-containing protein n=1 Tax=Plasmodiophora brassicae TaxID=37360 RepID=A0A3P3YIL5_PLABS|nr:unnamed protein product [Plasmodiophora brassicae]